ncbi:zinc-dependent alcohol dehydrogenase [Halomicrobium urmianum]|uniref:zinc-dependent alcohol dehydrogenase n=1 Tax=Halomicrobium urmianum TaxID=1586233 RepID=UPI001CDA115F|nr:alcohol dehydrogenase catalytic domain-containing protein [Halomicrobium urmianum]
MKAIVQTGSEQIEVQEREQPTPGPEEVLVEVHTAGLCGSDVHAYQYDGGYEWIPIPRIMGHEYSGRVAEVGENVDQFEVGQKVVEEPIHDCGHCFQCKNGQENVCQNFSITGMHTDGAYADYTVVDQRHLHEIPESVPLRDAAITEPTSIATRAILDQSETTPGDDVLVEGPGPIGVLSAVVADSLGANVVVSGLDKDTSYRLPLLEDQGIDTVNVQERDLETVAEERTDGGGFDVVVDATGHRSGLEEGLEYARKGGQIVMVGIPNEEAEVFMAPAVRGELEVNTSYGSKWRNFEQALRLMERGAIDVDAIVDTSYDVEDPEEAFRTFLDSETCKPVFTFAED